MAFVFTFFILLGGVFSEASDFEAHNQAVTQILNTLDKEQKSPNLILVGESNHYYEPFKSYYESLFKLLLNRNKLDCVFLESDNMLPSEIKDFLIKKNIPIYSVGEGTEMDTATMLFLELSRRYGKQAANKKIQERGLENLIAPNPKMYYFTDIIFRRNLEMTTEIQKAYDSKICSQAVAIAGSNHTFRKGPQGSRIYSDGRIPMTEIFQQTNTIHALSLKVLSAGINPPPINWVSSRILGHQVGWSNEDYDAIVFVAP